VISFYTSSLESPILSPREMVSRLPPRLSASTRPHQDCSALLPGARGAGVAVEVGSAPKPCLKHPRVHTSPHMETLVHACAAVPIHAGTLHVSLYTHVGVFRHMWAQHAHTGTHMVPHRLTESQNVQLWKGPL